MAYSKLKWTKYKFRAEGMNDVFAFQSKTWTTMIGGKFILSGTIGAPDVEYEFESPDTIEVLRKQLRGIPDGHVMRETLQKKSKYTGKRD